MYVSRQWVIRRDFKMGRGLSVAKLEANECQGVRYSNVMVTGNNAAVAGGGMFVTDLINLSAYRVNGSILGVVTNSSKKGDQVVTLHGNIVQVSAVCYD